MTCSLYFGILHLGHRHSGEILIRLRARLLCLFAKHARHDDRRPDELYELPQAPQRFHEAHDHDVCLQQQRRHWPVGRILYQVYRDGSTVHLVWRSRLYSWWKAGLQKR